MSIKKILISIAIVIVLFIIYAFSTYNSLVTLNVSADTQWKQVETLYQRRFDLIPSLVESVKGVMKQEQTVFTAISDARTKYSGATTVDEKAKAASEVEGSLGRLIAIAENYPQLKSSDVMQTFMSQQEGTENRISVERMRFNDSVKSYNLKVLTFPSSIIAAITGFDVRSYIEVATSTAIAPQVKF